MTNEFSNRAKPGNFQNVSFPKNREEIPMESISISFDTDFRESILKRRNLVQNFSVVGCKMNCV